MVRRGDNGTGRQWDRETMRQGDNETGRWGDSEVIGLKYSGWAGPRSGFRKQEGL